MSDAGAIERQRARWRSLPRERPARIVPPGPGQESVWDYPRPPRVEPVARPVRIEFAGQVVAASDRALRVVETSSPPCVYLPPEDVRTELLRPAGSTALCEWKGIARFWTLEVAGGRSESAAWSYPEPDIAYAAIRDHLAFFPGRVDACWLGDERAAPQPGSYYGGWITSAIVGPFKGGPGTEAW